MGMVLSLVTVSDETIDRLHAFPPLVWKVVAPDDAEAFQQAIGGETGRGFFSRLFGQKAVSPKVPELPDEQRTAVDLDKAWHGIHFLLTQTVWEGSPPLNFLLHGGKQVGDVDVGLGPARAMTSTEVALVNEALVPIEEDFLRSRFEPARMMELEIYPGIWDRDPTDDDALGYCLDNFKELKKLVRESAASRRGLVIFMS